MKTQLKDLLLLTCILSILFGVFLGTRVLQSPDEGRYVEIPREMLVTGDYTTPRLNGVKYFEKPILFYWIQAGAIKLFGLNEWAERLTTALLALCGCLMTFIAGNRVYGRTGGWLASLILGTSALYFIGAHAITTDMAVATFLTGSLLSFLMGITEKSKNARNAYFWSVYIFAALATLTKGLIGIIFPGMIIFLWLLFNNEWRVLRNCCLPSGILLFLAIVLPWHIRVQIKNPEFFQFYVLDQQFLRYFTDYAGREKPFWFLGTILATGLFPWATFVFQAVRNIFIKNKDKTALFLLIWPCVIFLFFQFSRSQLPLYILPVFPPIALLLAGYFKSAFQENDAWGLKTGFILSFSSCLLAGILFILLPHINALKRYIDILTVEHFYFWCLGGISISIALLGFLACRFKKYKAAFSLLIVGSFLFFSTILLSFNTFDGRSVKSLAMQLRPLLQAQTEVFSYHEYYQDLPPYLNRLISVVEWRGELDFGMRQEDTSAWMVNEKTFWEKWNSSDRKFVIMGIHDYETLKNQDKKHFYLLDKTSDNVLLTNHENSAL